MDERFNHRLNPAPPKSDRRSFLGAALATVTVAAVAGGTAALLLEDDEAPSANVITQVAPEPPPTMNPVPESDNLALRGQLISLETENVNLKNTLAETQRQLAAFQGTGAESLADEDWRRQYEEANTQATDLAGQLAIVQGLLALYEDLEAVDLADAASGGLAAVGGLLGDLIADVPLVTEGLSAGRTALEEFEEQLPLIEQGRYWLQGQISIVGSALEKAEQVLNNTLKAGGSFLQLLDRWFEDILRWLPFGIGEPALAIMSTINDLLARVPETLDGLQTHVADPLDLWLERDGDENRLQKHLVKPVREEAIDRADSAVQRLGAVNKAYETQLRDPVGVLVERQRVIREQIALYRQNYSL
jgi:hypothetical protein